MSLNKVVTSVNALANDITLPDSNNVVCIDTANNRIGVKTSTPAHEIDVNGTITTNKIILKDADGITTTANNGTINFGNINVTSITSDEYIGFNVLTVQKLIATTDISTANIYTQDLSANDICANNLTAEKIVCPLVEGDISFIGNVGISGGLTVSGDSWVEDIYYTGGSHTSDDRLKHNEQTIENALAVIRQLDPQVYQKTRNLKAADFSGVLTEDYIIEAGLIAQDVLKVDDLSFSVNVGSETRPYYLSYNNIFVYGLAALKELDAIVQLQNSSTTNNASTNNGSVNIDNLTTTINNQNLLIQNLNNKITDLTKRITVLENN